MPQIDIYTKQQIDNKYGSTVDSTPTQNSTNMVTSGGVYSAINNAVHNYETWQFTLQNGTIETRLVAIQNSPSATTETWTFTLQDGTTTVTKYVVVASS